MKRLYNSYPHTISPTGMRCITSSYSRFIISVSCNVKHRLHTAPTPRPPHSLSLLRPPCGFPSILVSLARSLCIKHSMYRRYVWAAALCLYSVLMRGLLCLLSPAVWARCCCCFSHCYFFFLFLCYSAHKMHKHSHSAFSCLGSDTPVLDD